MQYDVRYDPSASCLIGVFKGELNKSTMKTYLKKISSIAEAHPCKRFLNDLRDAEINLTVIDLFETPQMITTEAFNRNWWRAVLLPKGFDEMNREFFENVNLNRGIKLRTFTNYDEAISWLSSLSVS